MYVHTLLFIQEHVLACLETFILMGIFKHPLIEMMNSVSNLNLDIF